MQRTIYTGDKTAKISFPLGGIGTGSVGLGGNGRLLDWEICNRPAKGSLNGFSHFALKAEKTDGTLVDARVLNGDLKQDYSGQPGMNFGHGMPGGTMAGFPHFREHVFEGKFPTAEITFDDPHFPGRAKLFAFNPMIPLNDRDSSLPAAFFEILAENTSDEELCFTAAFSVRNPNGGSVNGYFENYRLRGIKLGQKDVPDDAPEKCDLTVATCDLTGSEQEYWYRGGWSDAIETFWRNFTEASDLKNRSYADPGNGDHATLAVKKKISPGECASFRFVLAWNKPNNYNYWNPLRAKDENGREKDVTWKNYYATIFEDSADCATYALANWDLEGGAHVPGQEPVLPVVFPGEIPARPAQEPDPDLLHPFDHVPAHPVEMVRGHEGDRADHDGPDRVERDLQPRFIIFPQRGQGQRDFFILSRFRNYGAAVINRSVAAEQGDGQARFDGCPDGDHAFIRDPAADVQILLSETGHARRVVRDIL